MSLEDAKSVADVVNCFKNASARRDCFNERAKRAVDEIACKHFVEHPYAPAAIDQAFFFYGIDSHNNNNKAPGKKTN